MASIDTISVKINIADVYAALKNSLDKCTAQIQEFNTALNTALKDFKEEVDAYNYIFNSVDDVEKEFSQVKSDLKNLPLCNVLYTRWRMKAALGLVDWEDFYLQAGKLLAYWNRHKSGVYGKPEQKLSEEFEAMLHGISDGLIDRLIKQSKSMVG